MTCSLAREMICDGCCERRRRPSQSAQSRLPASAPGLLVLAGFVGLNLVLRGRGVPPYLILSLCVVFVMIPAMLLIMGRAAKAEGRRLTEVVGNRAPAKWYVVLGLGLLACLWAGLIMSTVGKPIDAALRRALFSWLPAWFDVTDVYRNPGFYSKQIVIATWCVSLFATSVAGPIMEEIYFRGFLLSRLNGYGLPAPVLGITLFSLYHFWSPWMFVSRVVALVPMVFFVWRKRNIGIGIVAHCLLNLVGDSLSTIAIVFR